MGGQVTDQTRVGLPEVTATGRFFHCGLFPWLLGLLGARGVAGRWWRVEVPPDLRFHSDEQGISLGPEDLEPLLAALRALGPTHLLMNMMPAPSLVAAVRGARPRVALAVLDPGVTPLPDGVRGLAATVEEAAAFVGLDPDNEITPDFAFQALNAAAGKAPPVVIIEAGPECRYRRPLRHSAFFSARPDLVLPAEHGCTFCQGGRVLNVDAASRRVDPASGSPVKRRDAASTARRRQGRTRPPREKMAALLHRVERTLRAVAATHPPVSGRLRYRVLGDIPAAHLAGLTRAILESGAPPGRFLLDGRADELDRSADELARAVVALEPAGHRLEVCLVGLESLSAAQLDRYNKGYGPEVNLRCVRLLRRLEAEHPEAFGFSEHRGLSTILMDPWASLGDLALNLELVGRLGLEPLCGKLLTSRLRLYPDLPLAAAARAEGLLLERYDDPLLHTARRNLYADELPWRAASARVEAAGRLLVRLDPELEGAGDPLTTQVTAWRRGVGASPVDLGRRVIRAAAGQPGVNSAEQLLERAMQDDPASPEEAVAVAVRGQAPDLQQLMGVSEAEPDPAAARLEDALARSNPARGAVAKLEGFPSREAVEQVMARVRQLGPDRAMRPRQSAYGQRTWELFVAPDEALAAEAQHTAAALEAGRDPREIQQATARMGELLGYPSCCAGAFARQAPGLRGSYEWLWLRRRLEAPELLPWPHLELTTAFVPCSLTCARALTYRGALPPAHAAWTAGLARLPTLVLLDRPGEMVHMEALTPVGERFAYRAVRWRCSDPRLEALLAGDTLALEPGLVRVLRGERELAFFALDAFLWSHEAAPHRDFWQEVLAGLELPPVLARSAPEAPATVDHGPRGRLVKALEALIRELAGSGGLPAGMEPGSVKGSASGPAWGELEVTLARDGEPLRFYIQDGGAVSDPAARGERLCAFFHGHRPSEEERALAADLLERLELVV